MIEELLKNIENIEECIFRTIRSNVFKFKKEEMQFLNNFGDEIEKSKELAIRIGKDAFNNFDSSLRSIAILVNLRNLYVLLAIKIQDESNKTFLDGIISERGENAQLESIVKIIIDFKPAIKKLKRQYDEYLELENSNSIFEETKIDKNEILLYLNKSLTELSNETTIPQQEKEKLIIVYKEVIKEVEKKQTNWQKVLGFFNVMAIALTIYTSVPTVMQDLRKAYSEVTKGVNIFSEKKEFKIKVLDNQSIKLIEEVNQS
ncbi:hypothetical protein [Arcobacter sp. s6]|uniref:hypothetical protein n=1 Tax=Arcobacter sp. s6 TaxID=3230363 RepID=UPI0034A0204B